jgi:hypothetical protein
MNSENQTNLKMRSALIAFHRIRGNHTGASLARTVLYVLDRAGITVKTGHFTLDNAENNATMMKNLEQLLAERELPLEFDASDRRIMCFPHMMNICVQHLNDEISDPDFARLAEAWADAFDDSAVDKAFYLEAVKKNPVGLGRTIVRAIRASGLRRDEFLNVIRTGNLQEWFKAPSGEVEQIPELQLLRDVKTRWDSIYFMINRLRVLRPAVDLFLSMPTQKDITHYNMNETEWLVLRDYEEILDVSGTSVCTSSIQ